MEPENNSEQIHDCDHHPDLCPKTRICIQTTMNINSQNTSSFRMEQCNNNNQSWSLLMLNLRSHQSHYQILLLALQAPARDLLAMRGHALAHALTRSPLGLNLNLTVMGRAVSTYALTPSHTP